MSISVTYNSEYRLTNNQLEVLEIINNISKWDNPSFLQTTIREVLPSLLDEIKDAPSKELQVSEPTQEESLLFEDEVKVPKQRRTKPVEHRRKVRPNHKWKERHRTKSGNYYYIY